MRTQDTNFNPKMSSEPLEEKPFLTEDDGEQEVMKAGYYEQYHKSPGEYFFKGFMCASEKANARISSLESELKALENRYKDLSGALRFKYEECEALREERDKFAIEFILWTMHRELKNLPDESVKQINKLLEQFKAYTLNTEKN